MSPSRLGELLKTFARLRIAVVGDFCLDRYLEIDPDHRELSIETGLPVYKVDRVRAQPGAAGTVLNNLAALGVGSLLPIGFCGDDGEGFELERCLRTMPAVSLEGFQRTALRRTFTYCKPLLVREGHAPVELNRLDSKNGTPTPQTLRDSLASAIRNLCGAVDAIVVMDQVDLHGTGVISAPVLDALAECSPELPVLADSRNGFSAYPPLLFKMNRTEFATLTKIDPETALAETRSSLEGFAQKIGKQAFVTLAEGGILGAAPGAPACWSAALPVRGPIDVVGAGDSVTAALAAALAAGASTLECMELAMLAASLTVHQLGTTGTASPADLVTLHASLTTLGD
jgi:rfaE bifunctional protein kinase chain/domain